MSDKIKKLLRFASQFEENANLLIKKGNAKAFYVTLGGYEKYSDAVKDFTNALKMQCENFKSGVDISDPVNIRIYSLMKKQVDLVAETIPELEYLDQEIAETTNEEVSDK